MKKRIRRVILGYMIVFLVIIGIACMFKFYFISAQSVASDHDESPSVKEAVAASTISESEEQLTYSLQAAAQPEKPQPLVAVAKSAAKAEIINLLPQNTTKTVALTFDDGPDNKFTPQILDILKQSQIKATFFIVGSQAAKYPEVVKRIAREGHEIGNHSYNHKQLTKLNKEAAADEIDKTDKLLKSITGKTPYLFRAPYGAVSKDLQEVVASSGHKMIVGWSVDTKDWAGTSDKLMLEKVKKETHNGAIILMHSFGGKKGDLSNTVKALPKLIVYYRNSGYDFVKVTDTEP